VEVLRERGGMEDGDCPTGFLIRENFENGGFLGLGMKM
jgi:hypothetical protein